MGHSSVGKRRQQMLAAACCSRLVSPRSVCLGMGSVITQKVGKLGRRKQGPAFTGEQLEVPNVFLFTFTFQRPLGPCTIFSVSIRLAMGVQDTPQPKLKQMSQL